MTKKIVWHSNSYGVLNETFYSLFNWNFNTIVEENKKKQTIHQYRTKLNITESKRSCDSKSHSKELNKAGLHGKLGVKLCFLRLTAPACISLKIVWIFKTSYVFHKNIFMFNTNRNSIKCMNIVIYTENNRKITYSIECHRQLIVVEKLMQFKFLQFPSNLVFGVFFVFFFIISNKTMFHGHGSLKCILLFINLYIFFFFDTPHNEQSR